MSFFQRKRRFLPLLVPLLLVLIFFSLTGRSVRRVPWYEQALWNIVSPPQRALSAIGDGLHGIWEHYVALVGASRENDELRARIAELEGKLVTSEEARQENERLRALLSYRQTFPQEMLMARVIASDPRAEFKSITIDRGYKDGVEPLMPVVGPRGLVGKVGEVAAHTARVLLIIDPNSAVDAMVQRSRARGLVVGTADRAMLRAGHYLTRLEYLRRVSDIRDGDVVVTSGLDRAFPSGIPVGTVHDMEKNRYGVFREASVVPFEDMAELQEVLVILNRTDAASLPAAAEMP